VVNDGYRQRSVVNQLTIQFSEPVDVASVTALSLFNLTTSAAVDISAATLLGDGTAEVTWNLAGTELINVAAANTSDGYYVATLATAGVTDSSGNPLSADYEFLFHKMAGDGNGDAKVSAADFSEVVNYWDPLAGDVGRDGDLNGDGKVSAADFSVVINNWDVLGLPALPTVMIVETGGSTDVAEGGDTDTYKVVLARPVGQKPTADVTIALYNTDGQVTAADDANPANAFLVFSPGNWNAFQRVHVTAIDDGVVEGLHTGEITHSTSSSDPSYHGISGIESVTANVTDNDPSELMADARLWLAAVRGLRGPRGVLFDKGTEGAGDGSVQMPNPRPAASIGLDPSVAYLRVIAPLAVDQLLRGEEIGASDPLEETISLLADPFWQHEPKASDAVLVEVSPGLKIAGVRRTA
jgi:hypothetical protein